MFNYPYKFGHWGRGRGRGIGPIRKTPWKLNSLPIRWSPKYCLCTRNVTCFYSKCVTVVAKKQLDGLWSVNKLGKSTCVCFVFHIFTVLDCVFQKHVPMLQYYKLCLLPPCKHLNAANQFLFFFTNCVLCI